jgi:hypothetical protein
MGGRLEERRKRRLCSCSNDAQYPPEGQEQNGNFLLLIGWLSPREIIELWQTIGGANAGSVPSDFAPGRRPEK